MSTSTKRQERLEHLVKNYRKTDLDGVWNKYTALCKRTSTETKKLLEDATLYDQDNISVSLIQETIQNAINDIVKSNEGLRTEFEEAREAKRRKLETAYADSRNIKCEECGGKKIISINSKACDNNRVTLPWGREIEGYCPTIPAVTMSGGDGASFDLCVNCGFIVGFNREAVAAVMEELEQSYPVEDNNNDDN
eukprot:TRINITY_DN8602_c0_g1_i1.p1 TRINITY_DN8602_c0_g1~~TRINITY_DN8602_c0_g1_i1.p1  ORF type:complete len:201 (-),score=13.76 TRINITY_DN8602_c0_g1_i1:87-668(-)